MSIPMYYAVRAGRVPGIYPDWPSCEAQVTGFKGAKFKKFATREEADIFMAIVPPISGKRKTVTPGKLKAAKKQLPDFSRVPADPSILYRKEDKAPAKPAKRIKSGPSVFDPAAALPGLTIYTDGSCSRNGTVKARAGAGVYFGPDDPRNLAEPVPLERYAQTSNAGELYAAVRALQVTQGLPEAVTIVSDSSYLVENMRDSLDHWKISGKWDSPEKLPNMALWHELDALVTAHTPGVRFMWVKGHASCAGNIAADAAAKKGRLKHLD
jgi:ribonuclease HI